MIEMTDRHTANSSRREFLKHTGRVAAASTLVAGVTEQLYAGESNTIQVALVGCGGRGTGAARNAFFVDNGPVKLVAMADVFPRKLAASHGRLDAEFTPECIDVPEERRFIGFDAYRKAMDCLRPGDLVILATPPAFRWVHFTCAIEKGLNVFMEKPVTVDGPTTRRMLELNIQAKQKNLKVGVGLMCRHCDARRELFDRIQNGEIGDVSMLRAYRMSGLTATEATVANPQPDVMSELMYQIDRFHAFLWLSGGAMSDFLIHNIDECCWMKDAWPVKAKASGGRHYRTDPKTGQEYIDQNFDTYEIEYTFADGTKAFVNGRTMPGCHSEFATYAHGSKGVAVVSTAGHVPARSRIYDGHNLDNEKLVWAFGQREPNPYQLEWKYLIEAIRSDADYNEVDRGTMASLVTSMGRMAAHTGRIVTLEEMMNCEHEFAPDIDKLTMNSPSPLGQLPNGKYPVPVPGLVRDREYLQ